MTACFDQPGVEGAGAQPNSTPPERPDHHPVVGHQMEAGVERLQRQVALAGSGRALRSARRASTRIASSATRPACRITSTVLSSRRRPPPRTARPSPRRPRWCGSSAWILPPCASMIWRAMDRPRPELLPERRAARPGGRRTARTPVFQVLRRHAGTIVVDLDRWPARARGSASPRHRRAAGEDRTRALSTRLRNTWLERPLAPSHCRHVAFIGRLAARAGRRRGGWSRRGRRCRAAAASARPAAATSRDSSASRRGRVRDVGDQAIQASDVLLQYRLQPVAPGPAPSLTSSSASPPPSGSTSAGCGSPWATSVGETLDRLHAVGERVSRVLEKQLWPGRRARPCAARRCRAARWPGTAIQLHAVRRGGEPRAPAGRSVG